MNNIYSNRSDFAEKEYRKAVEGNLKMKPFRLTPYIATFCEGDLTDIDVQNFIEVGLRIIRFKTRNLSRKDKIDMLDMIKAGVKKHCAKFNVPSWPITLAIDIPNACIRSGILKKEIKSDTIVLERDKTVKITRTIKYWDKCDASLLFIDDPYTFGQIKVGTEITMNYGKVVLICTKIIDKNTVECKILRGDELGSAEFVCIRGVIHMKPALTKLDLDLIKFAIDYKMDIIIINSVRRSGTLKKVRNMMPKHWKPLIISAICEQEGLDNIDDIIINSDAIILSREFLAYEINDKHKMTTIQLYISAKCKQLGKPCYLSGNILEQTLSEGLITECDLNDVTNAVLQGYGFVLRGYNDTSHLLKTIKILDDICKTVESVSFDSDIWRMIDEYKMPVNAAESCVVACALTAKQTNSVACIVPTVTGYTAIQLSHISPGSIILTVSTNPVVANRLLVYRGIIPIVYDKHARGDWYAEIDARINCAVAYGIKNDILNYGQIYIVLSKSSPTSSFADCVRVCRVSWEFEL